MDFNYLKINPVSGISDHFSSRNFRKTCRTKVIIISLQHGEAIEIEGKDIFPQDLEEEVRYHPRRRKKLKWDKSDNADTGFTVYRDGFNINGRVKAAVVALPDGNVLYRKGTRLEDHCSVFQAEACSMLLAVSWVKEHKIRRPKLKVETQAAIKPVCNAYHANSLTKEIQNTIHSI